MHRAYLFAATMLLGIASLSFTALAISMPRENAVAGDSKHQEQIVRRFYDAVNLQIKTGDSTALADVMHPDFIDENPLPGLAPGPAGIVEYVDNLYANVPGASIEIETIIANDEDVIAVVSVLPGDEWEALDGWIDYPASIWSPVERFRVANGRIIERLGPAHGLSMLQKGFDLPLELSADNQQSVNTRHLTFESSGSARFHTSAGPAILHVISGELAISTLISQVTADVHIQVAEKSPLNTARTLKPGAVTTIQPGTPVTIPVGVTLTVNSATGPAVALYISTAVNSPLGQGIRTVPYSSERVAVRELGWFASDELPAGSVRITMNRISLMPGASISRAKAPGIRPPLMWLDTGAVLTELDHPAGNGEGATGNNRLFVSGVHLSPDVGLAYLWSLGAALHNTGEKPAMIWTIAVGPPGPLADGVES